MELEYRCDRCGETYSLKEVNNITYVQMSVLDARSPVPSDYAFNLCPSCMKTLNNWLKGNIGWQDTK